ncbi:hypothetical protein GPJ56_004875 [Histomonas meleagridis]|uniref:uncharacterized protein n=1 Tax=Histomonas meleagridis TaxID=135588 RepID=UPI00355949F9|nr:hypothetical protein GPJ56_004875 [Histomonas meleagridis]KAH0803525.1 hypothetical protein GO595_003869 [Histomonas meleagridis]
MVLVIGKDHRYWPHTKVRTPEQLDEWVNSITLPYTEISTQEELESAKLKPTGGGSTFYLVISPMDPSLNQFIKSLRYTQRFNDTFIVKFNYSISKPRLLAYHSPDCFDEFYDNISSLSDFVDRHKFGIFHRYESDELEDLIKQRNAIIYVSERPLNSFRMNNLRNIARQRCLDNFAYGWITIEDNIQVLKILNVSITDVPFLFGINRQKGVKSVYKLRINDAEKNGFFDSILNEGKAQKLSNMQSAALLSALNFILVFMCSAAWDKLTGKQAQKIE